MQPHADTTVDHAAEVIPTVRPDAPWRVARVEALPDFSLRVRFNDGSEGSVELRGFIESPAAGVFAALRDKWRFREARVVMGAVTWPGGLDLAPDAMHREIAKCGRWIVT